MQSLIVNVQTANYAKYLVCQKYFFVIIFLIIKQKKINWCIQVANIDLHSLNRKKKKVSISKLNRLNEIDRKKQTDAIHMIFFCNIVYSNSFNK